MLPNLDELLEPFQGLTNAEIKTLADDAGLGFWQAYRVVKFMSSRPSYETVRRIVNARPQGASVDIR